MTKTVRARYTLKFKQESCEVGDWRWSALVGPVWERLWEG